MQVVQKMSNFDGIRSISHMFSYPIYSHMALPMVKVWINLEQIQTEHLKCIDNNLVTIFFLYQAIIH
jgi:hypothetical protein